MSRVAPKHRAPKPEPLATPEGCFRCGIGGLLGWHDERWWCARHFFAEPGKRWPKPKPLALAKARRTFQITIDDAEYRKAEDGGRKRQDRAWESGYKRDTGVKGENEYEKGLAYHILGAAGEIAFAKIRNVEWELKLDSFRKGFDVDGHQVRTRSKESYGLNIKENELRDHNGQWFVLLFGSYGGRAFKLHGRWMLSPTVLQQHPEWKSSHAVKGGKGYFVPKEFLEAFPPELVINEDANERAGDDERATAREA